MTEWRQHNLLDLTKVSKEEIELVLETAKSFKEVSSRDVKKVPALRGKTVVMLFFEPSTRTRASFELAAKRLSADTINIAANSSICGAVCFNCSCNWFSHHGGHDMADQQGPIYVPALCCDKSSPGQSAVETIRPRGK